MIRRKANGLKEKIMHHFQEVLSAKYTPHSIALGFSLGTFLAIFPTPGLSIVIGFILLLIFPKINKLSMMAAFALWNPMTLIPIYLLSYHIGSAVIGDLPMATIRIHLVGQVYNFTRSFLIGNILLSMVFGIASYILIRSAAEAYYKRIERQEHKDSSQDS